jgi:putative glutamine amidotransferase
MPKVYLSGSLGGHWPHAAFGEPTYDFNVVLRNPDNVSLIIVPGGADIDPAIYGHKVNSKTHISSGCDVSDVEAIDFAVKHEIPIAGICRGGQMLIAKAGGYLYQHTTGHGQEHLVETKEGFIFPVTSCHHQMYGWPLPPNTELLAWSHERRSMCYEMAEHNAPPPLFEPECVYIPEMNALATQWHPEWMRNEEDEGYRYYQYLLEKYLRPVAAKKFKSLK